MSDCSDMAFWTADEIDVFQRDFVPIDKTMTYLFSVIGKNLTLFTPSCLTLGAAVTEWDIIDGIPLQHQRLDSASARDLDLLLPHCDSFCLPIYGDSTGFVFSSEFSSRDEKRQVGYASPESVLLIHSMRMLAPQSVENDSKSDYTDVMVVEDDSKSDYADVMMDESLLFDYDCLGDENFDDEQGPDCEFEAELVALQNSLLESQRAVGFDFDDDVFDFSIG